MTHSPKPPRPARPLPFLWAPAALACLLLLPLLAQPPARAATTRTVTTYADTVNPNDNLLSLREAISISAAGDTIVLPYAGSITLSLGELVIGRALTINGPGARKFTIDAHYASRIFNVSGTGAVTLKGMRLWRGQASLEQYGPDGWYRSAFGGGIRNTAPLTMVECSVVACLAQGEGGNAKGGGAAGGGGIHNKGSLTMRGCTLYGNYAYSGQGVGTNLLAYGGGIHSQAQFTLIQTTLDSNSAQHNGAGILAGYFFTSKMIGCTVTRNFTGSAFNGAAGGISSHYSGDVVLRNCLIAKNKAVSAPSDVSGDFTSEGHNLIGVGDHAVGPNFGPPWGPTDLTGTEAAPLDPLVGTLVNNSGPTDTVALLPGSSALEAGDDQLTTATFGLTKDQRGLNRRIGTHVDIGAYERDLAQPGPTFTVNSIADPGDGIPGAAECTLREAITAANAQPDANTINFSLPAPSTITLDPARGPILISNALTIAAANPRQLAVSGGGVVRIFNVTGQNVNLNRITLRNGWVRGTAGQTGGIGVGGAINTTGTLALTNCALLYNTVNGGTGTSNSGGSATGGDGLGGAIYNTGTLTLRGCTLAGNYAYGGDAFLGAPETSGSGLGGAIYNYGTASLTNCTVSDNFANAGFYGFGGKGSGGGIYNAGIATASRPTSTVTLLSCTVAGNRAAGVSGSSAGGLYTQRRIKRALYWNFMQLQNCIVSLNTADGSPDTYGNYKSDGNNLVSMTDNSAGWATTDKTGTSSAPRPSGLQALANNGGMTDTRGLAAGSQAINAANTAAAPTTDQRNAARVAAADMGAFEAGGTPH